jgi:cation diffusion facilitator family transporter
MSLERRTALVSVGAACVLIAIKLAAGIGSGSLGLLAEAAHSGTDLAAALLTLFAVSVSVRPADRGHPFGHAKAQNLAALGEAGFLIAVSLVIAGLAVARLAGAVSFKIDATWWTFAAVALVLAIDSSRLVVSLRAGRRYRSDALLANALHFGSDLAGTLAVLAGLVAASFGFHEGDAIAALFVAALVVVAALQLLGHNVNVLMDRLPEEAERAARRAISALDPPVELRRLRVRRSGAAHFADAVIGIAPGAAVGQGHAAADRVEEAVRRVLPDADVVVHVEPRGADGELRERALAAALEVPQVREIHNLAVLDVHGRTEVSLHLKLPGELSLDRAHEIAERVEREIASAVPEAGDHRAASTRVEDLLSVDPVEADSLGAVDVWVNEVQVAREHARLVGADLRGERARRHQARSRGRATCSRNASRSVQLFRRCSAARSRVSARSASGSTPCWSSSCR